MELEEIIAAIKDILDTDDSGTGATVVVVLSGGDEVEVSYDDDGVLTWTHGRGEGKEIEEIAEEIYNFADERGAAVISVASL